MVTRPRRSGSASAPSAVRLSRSTSGRRSKRCSRTASPRRGSSLRSRRSRSAGRHSRTGWKRSPGCASGKASSRERASVRGLRTEGRRRRPPPCPRNHRHEQRLHRPRIAARLRPRRHDRSDPQAARRRAPGRDSGGLPTVAYGEGDKVTAKAFIEKVPALLTLAAGSSWVEIDERNLPVPERARTEQALCVSVLRNTVRQPARIAPMRQRHCHRCIDLGLCSRDGGRRTATRLSARRSARGRRRSKPCRPRGGVVRHRPQVR